jgi:hypothetical protein
LNASRGRHNDVWKEAAQVCAQTFRIGIVL